jgi:hypothetical protein
MSTPATNPLTYNSYVTAVGTMAVIASPATDPNLTALMPQMLNYAELRIQRDLDLLPLQTDNSGYSLTAGNNVLSLSVNDFVTVQNIAVLSGTQRTTLTPVTKEYLQAVFDDSTFVATPQYFAPYGGDASTGGDTSLNFLVGPAPDQSYQLLVTGTTRAPSLFKYANTVLAPTATTFISAFLPDLLLMASMVFISAYQRNFSASADDPNMAINYEKTYQTLLKGAMGEELRKRFRASAWSSEAPSPAATSVRA